MSEERMMLASDDPEGALDEAVVEFLEAQGHKKADREMYTLFDAIVEKEQFSKLREAGIAHVVEAHESDLEDGLEAAKGHISAAVKGFSEVFWLDESDDGFFMMTLLLGDREHIMKKMAEIRRKK